MENFSLNFGGEETQCVIEKMAQNVARPGTPGGIIEYLDFSEQKDNGSYVPDLENGMLQPVEIFDKDLLLSQIDLEKLLQEAENSTKDLPQTTADGPEKTATD